MKLFHLIFLLGMATGAALGADEDGFVPLFNGNDLSGWINVNCSAETWRARDGLIHCTGFPTGALRTPRQYENFILELEWRHLSKGGNSGVFIWASPLAAPGVPFLRGIEVQVLDHGFDGKGKNEWYTTHGDVFPIHGAEMKPFGRHNGMRSFPSEDRSKGSPEWNHYRVVCSNGVIRLHVNGKEVSGGEDCNYRKGYLGLESEGAPVDFRNVRIQELPSSSAPAELSAPVDLGWRSIFTGLDLRGWKTNAATANRWQATGEHLVLKDGGGQAEATLWTEKVFGDAELVLDCRPGKIMLGSDAFAPEVKLRGEDGPSVKIRSSTLGVYQRFTITIQGRTVIVKRNGQETQTILLPSDTPTRGALGLRDAGAAAEFMNLYIREL